MSQPFSIIDWQDGHVVLLDQRLLPTQEKYVHCQTVAELAEAICNMTVRGAPASGVVAALGLALSAYNSKAQDFKSLWTEIEADAQTLGATRPTAVNLSWGLGRIKALTLDWQNEPVSVVKNKILDAALKIKDQDIKTNRSIGMHGQTLLSDGDTVLTHCNAGALCSAGYGTALGVVYAAIENGKKIQVYADETRPLLQGARLTAWELTKNNVPTTVITDNMAASMMKAGLIQKIIVGADRIAANGDVANKIGTYGLAIAAQYHNIPFYVAAPFSTIDLNIASGADIPIEERHPKEVSEFGGQRVVPLEAQIRNPAFDVTPHQLVSAIVTEVGVVKQPFAMGLQKLSETVRQNRLAN